MTNEEILKKDWQLLTAHALIHLESQLETVLQNQAVIISELKKIPIADVANQMATFQKENYQASSELFKKNIPDYPLIQRKYE
jgi:hypothetical protein